MIKQLCIAACISLPLAALAANPAQAPASQPGAKSSKGELKAQQNRGAKMGACLKQADDKCLTGTERKTFLGECVKAP